MPLSEHEQRLLDQIEQGLYAEDPKFASTVSRARVRSSTRRRLIFSVAGAVIGLGLVLLGLVTTVIVVSVVGFLLIVASCAWALTGGRRRGGTDGIVGSPKSGPTSKSKRPSGGMKERMEDRLRRRFDEN